MSETLSQLLPVLAVEDRLTPGGGRSWDLYMSTLEAIRASVSLFPPRAPPPEFITLPRGASDGQGDLRSTAGDSAGRKLCESSFARKANAQPPRESPRRSIRYFIFYLNAPPESRRGSRKDAFEWQRKHSYKSINLCLEIE